MTFVPERGREARPSSTAAVLAKTVVQMVVFWVTFFGVFPALVWELESGLGLSWWRFPCPLARGAGAGGFVLGGALGITCAVTMAVRGRGTPMPHDCARELVVAGPYRYVRNPMAIAGLAQGAAVGVFLGSPAVVLYALTGGPVWNRFVRPWEERDLEHRFGEPYHEYRAAVGCWVPRWPGYHSVPHGPGPAATPSRL